MTMTDDNDYMTMTSILLKEKIQNDLKVALKSGDKITSLVLRTLASSIKNAEIAKRTKLAKTKPLEDLEKLSQLDNEEIVQVISREIKQRRDSVEQFTKGKRLDLVEKETKEIEILSHYLPPQLSEEEIRNLVKEAIKKTDARSVKETGKVMGIVMSQVKGRADGAQVSKIVKEELTRE